MNLKKCSDDKKKNKKKSWLSPSLVSLIWGLLALTGAVVSGFLLFIDGILFSIFFSFIGLILSILIVVDEGPKTEAAYVGLVLNIIALLIPLCFMLGIVAFVTP